jgi:hypothetical protein
VRIQTTAAAAARQHRKNEPTASKGTAETKKNGSTKAFYIQT